MKRTNPAHSLRFLTAAGLLLVLFAGSSLTLAAPVNKGWAAEISVSGEGENGAKPFLKLNGEPVLSGRTFFSYSTLETPQNVSADINLPGLGRVSLSPGTMLSLGFSDNNITGRLHAGKIRVSATAGTKVDIETPDNRLVNDPAVAGTFTLDISSGSSEAVSESGTVFLSDGAPAGRGQTTASSPNVWVPAAIWGGLVATSVFFVLLNRVDDDDRAEDVILSPVR
jgi:hypothetical protein